ncbi:methylated-DNA--[protein]-cysteine S-methyltransferase [Acidithiobacillus sp. IBUN Pt1247-S3]|uniref:methylated-DNA--[protein]-cysteine S-methyltransferase n=1 Tax=Acidithiobacillus sp. IBUN Pt1247-S3 TaxID=3166642 RepID=UPI0034E5E6C1
MDSSPSLPASLPGVVGSHWLYTVEPIGTVSLEFFGTTLVGLHPLLGQAEDLPYLDSCHPLAQTLAAYAAADFVAYERLRRRLPMRASGTPFQRCVWNALQKIPLGRVRSYGELASVLHNAPRAVGQACRRNPIAILIPCHRVLAKHGLGGYSGKREGAEIAYKDLLLRHEGVEYARA